MFVFVGFSFLLLQVSLHAEDHLLDAVCLQHLLTRLTGDNLSLYFNDYTDQILDGESGEIHDIAHITLTQRRLWLRKVLNR